jgi:(2R)-3-sulfolactate dehydrogenase (NADP+)
LFVAIDASAFGNALPRFAEMARAIEEQEGARLPGSRRLAMRARAERDGLQVSDALLAEIKAL